MRLGLPVFCQQKTIFVDDEIAGNGNPVGVESGKTRLVRGGSYLDWPKDCRSAKRREYNPGRNYSDIGFRIIRR